MRRSTGFLRRVVERRAAGSASPRYLPPLGPSGGCRVFGNFAYWQAPGKLQFPKTSVVSMGRRNTQLRPTFIENKI